MKQLIKFVPLILIFAFLGCAGEELSTDDINNISSALTTAYSSLQFTPTTKTDPLFYASTININSTTACPVAGHITALGSFLYTYNETTYVSSLSGQVTFNVSDPTNNLNDCEVGNGIILDGSIYLTMSGTNANLTGVLDGTIGINKRGPTGGLVPITDDCSIFLSFSTTKISGTICGHTVSN